MDLAGDRGRHARDARGASGSRPAGPTVLRMALGNSLRKLRERAGVSREAAADAIRGSEAKISRMELGRVGLKQRDVADLLTLFGVTDLEERNDFLQQAEQSRRPGWWHAYADLLPPLFETYLDLEQAASVIRPFELQFVPHLLQTPDYTRAVAALGHRRRASEVDRLVQLREQQQRLLVRACPPVLWAIVDEAVLRRAVGPDPAVLRGQLEHLLAMSERPNVALQIVPLSYPARIAVNGSFTLLRFAQPDLPDIVHMDQLTAAHQIDRRADVESYAMLVDRLAGRLEPPERAPGILRGVLADLV